MGNKCIAICQSKDAREQLSNLDEEQMIFDQKRYASPQVAGRQMTTPSSNYEKSPDDEIQFREGVRELVF